VVQIKSAHIHAPQSAAVQPGLFSSLSILNSGPAAAKPQAARLDIARARDILGKDAKKKHLKVLKASHAIDSQLSTHTEPDTVIQILSSCLASEDIKTKFVAAHMLGTFAREDMADITKAVHLLGKCLLGGFNYAAEAAASTLYDAALKGNTQMGGARAALMDVQGRLKGEISPHAQFELYVLTDKECFARCVDSTLELMGRTPAH
jgi:hypothetical protein